MPLTTVPVTVTVKDTDGQPVAGASVTTLLSGVDVDMAEGYVFPELYSGTTDINGVYVLNLWPNVLGTRSTYYKVSIVNPQIGKILKVQAQVPNSASSLHIIGAFVDGTVSFDENLVSVQDLYTARDAAQASAVAAASSASAASSSATAASGSATTASNAASAANTYANNSLASATSASASATAAANTATAIATTAPGSNLIINGNFDFWQRGTSQVVGGVLSADRFEFGVVGGVSFLAQRVTLGPSVSASWDVLAKYGMEVQLANVDSTDYVLMRQNIINGARNTAGKSLTTSFWAKTSLPSAKILLEPVRTFGTGGSPSIPEGVGGSTTFTLTPTWTKYTATISIASIVGKTFGTSDDDLFTWLMLLSGGSGLAQVSNGSLGTNNGTISIAQIKCEIGTTSTPFSIVSLADEFNKCRAFYQTSAGEDATRSFYNGQATSAAGHTANVVFPTPMWTAPTVTLTNVLASNFPTSVGSLTTATKTGFGENRVASGTGYGFFISSWVAKTE